MKRIQVLARHCTECAKRRHQESLEAQKVSAESDEDDDEYDEDDYDSDSDDDDENPWDVGPPQIWTKQMIEDANEEGQAIVVIHGKVYDCTEFLPEHPGGGEVITDINALDFEEMDEGFDEAEHSEESVEDMKFLYVGELATEEQEALAAEGEELPEPPREARTLKAIFKSIPDMEDMYESDDEEANDDDGDDGGDSLQDSLDLALQEIGVAASGGVFKNGKRVSLPLPLVEKLIVNHNTRLFRFLLPEDAELGLPIGKHLSLTFNDENGARVSRRYTPTSLGNTVGHVDLVVKVYFANEHPQYPLGGKLTQFLEHMQVGDSIDVEGPKGKLQYVGAGQFAIQRKGRGVVVQPYKRVGMIAGGTGITPMYQVIKALALEYAATQFDGLDISVIFANQTKDDILLFDELEALLLQYPKLKLWYTLDQLPTEDGTEGGWAYSTGFVTPEMMVDHLPPAGEGTLILMCGPKPMIKSSCVPALDEMGYEKEMQFVF